MHVNPLGQVLRCNLATASEMIQCLRHGRKFTHSALQSFIRHPGTFLHVKSASSYASQMLATLSTATDANDTVQMLVTKILNQHSIRHERASELKSKVTSAVQYLTSMQCSFDEIENLSASSPRFFLKDSEKNRLVVGSLIEYGFSKESVMNILMKWPAILNTKRNTLIERLECLREFGFKDDQMLEMVTRTPHVLELAPKSIAQQIWGLKEFFSDRDVLLCVSKSPNVLFESWETTQYKFHYVHFIMGVQQHEIMQTSLFSHPIMRIRARHTFLQRAGLFAKPDNKGRFRMENPPLKQIIDSTDKHFAEQVANLPLEDYNTFWQLLEYEDLPEIQE